MGNGTMLTAMSPVDIFAQDLFPLKVGFLPNSIIVTKLQKFVIIETDIVKIKKMFLENFCATSPCKNGAICGNNIEGNGYECVCKGTYRGKDCEISIDDDK